MKINEINSSQSLALEIIMKNNTISIPLTLIQTADVGILVQSILMDGRRVGFDANEEVKYNVICSISDKKPYIWKGVLPRNMLIKNNPCVLIKMFGDGVPFNRRGAFRLPLDIKSKLKGGDPVILHDLSCTGMSFYLPKDHIQNIGTSVSISFDFQYEQYTITGTIVRQVNDDENNRILYGCEVKPSPVIDNLISEMQRKMMHKSSR